MTTAARSTADPSTPVVRCDSLARTYGSAAGIGRADRAAVEALSGVTLSLDRGELVGVTGASGSGKTTLLHLLAALDTPTSGTVELLGRDVGRMGERERARLRLEHVGVVFQRFHLLPALTARANVALPLVERGVGRRARRDRADDLLGRIRMADRADHRPGELSGGEQQRVAIARALANDPDLVVADEPTGELDTDTGAVIVDLLREVATDRAVVVASHDPTVVDGTDRTLTLRDGVVVDRG